MIDPLYIDENMNICARIEDTKKLNSFQHTDNEYKVKTEQKSRENQGGIG